MRRYAHELDKRARHGDEQARRDQSGRRTRDTKFLKSASHFAERANRFHDRVDEYRTKPWNVDEELEHLLKDARGVQERIRRARFADGHTRQDWDQVVRLLSQMLQEYRGALTDRNGRYLTDTAARTSARIPERSAI